jgi:uncharacterized protein (TIGR04222 family)
MILYGAPGDTEIAAWGRFRQAASTWQISGPAFLRVYVAVSAVVLIGTVLYRRRLIGGSPPAPADLSAHAAAYLHGGPKLAIYASLAGLRTAGAIDVADDRRLRQIGPMPAGATPLDQAVYNAAGSRIQPRDLARHVWVKDGVRELQESLEQTGLLATAKQRQGYRAAVLLLVGLVALGVARLIAGIANGRPVGYLVLALIVLTVATAILLVRAVRRTRAGEQALERLRVDHRYLAPWQQPSWSTYGHADASMGVALFGTTALWAADPAFASASEVERQFATVRGGEGGGDGGGHSGGSYGGGSSCGGGGGCGGGGCGG